MHPGEALVDLIDAVGRVWSSTAEIADVGDVVAHPDLAQSRNGLAAGNPQLRVDVAEPEQVERIAVRRVVVDADQQVVDARSVPRMRFQFAARSRGLFATVSEGQRHHGRLRRAWCRCIE